MSDVRNQYEVSELSQFDVELAGNDWKYPEVITTEDTVSGGNSQVSNSQDVNSKKVDAAESRTVVALLSMYFAKFKGVDGKKSADRQPPFEVFCSFVLSFIGIFLVSVTSFWYLTRHFKGEHDTAVTIMTGAYGATAVLLYDSYLSPLAQPRNVIGSYLVCSLTGVIVRIVCGHIGLERWVTAAFAVAFSIITMNITKTVHPPGGACALLAIVGGPAVWNLGFGYVATAVGGVTMMVIVALIGNNLVPTRQYPVYWW